MTVYDLVPAFVELKSHSVHGAHVALIPTRDWSPTPLVPGNTGGSYTNWSGIPCDGQEMIEDFVDKAKVFFPTTYTFDTATIFTKASTTDPAIPRAGVNLGVAGTDNTFVIAKATMATWLFRDTDWKLSKIVFLDYASDANFDPITTVVPGSPVEDFIGAVTSPSWAWASRAGNRPATFTKLTSKMSDELRKRYSLD